MVFESGLLQQEGSHAEKGGKICQVEKTALPRPLKPTTDDGPRDSLKHLPSGRFLQLASQKLFVKTSPQPINNGRALF